MGYTSDVGAMIYVGEDVTDKTRQQELYDQLKLIMNTTYKTLLDDHFGSCITWNDDTKTMEVRVDCTKWYDNFPDVQQFMSMLDAFGDGEYGNYAAEFLRVGEDPDDNEQRSYGNSAYRLSLRREIEFD